MLAGMRRSKISHWMRAGAGTVRVGAVAVRAQVILGLVAAIALVVAAYAQDLDAEVLKSLAEEQVIVTQDPRWRLRGRLRRRRRQRVRAHPCAA